jgi:hypothetical protein
MFITLTSFGFSQTPVFNNTVNINQNFTSDSEIFPFNGQILYGIGINGNIIFNSDSSLVRVIIRNSSGLEYLIYETYPMLDTIWNFTVNAECEETCFLDDYIGISLIIQIRDASIYLSQLKWSSNPSESAEELQRQAKHSKDLEKIEQLNDFIEKNNLLWTAGLNSYANLYYKNKLQLFGNKYNSYGFEYYSGGIFGKFDDNYIYDPDYEIVDHFDWREKHDANIEGTNYFDGNPDAGEIGNGWMTSVKCQGGCWNPLTQDYQCEDEQGNCPEGYNHEGTGACTGFTVIGILEAMMNIYYNNQNINLDLSEMELSATEDPNLSHPCNTVCDGGSVSGNLDYAHNYGIMDENHFPFVPLGDPEPCPYCNLQLPNPSEVIKIQGKLPLPLENQKILKQSLIKYGPIGWSDFNFSTFSNHAMVFVGFGTIYEGMELYGIPGPILPGDDYIGRTFWIFKNSGGPNWGNNGYAYMMLTEFPTNNAYRIVTPIYSQINSYNRLCDDKDIDGFYNWGIGDAPAGCSGEMDGNDNDQSLGPMDDNGYCRIINTHFTSFEKDLEGWKQCEGDDREWIRHNANTPYIPPIGSLPEDAIDGDYYIFINSKALPVNGTAILESPLIDLSENSCSYLFNFWYYRPNNWGYNDAVIEVQSSTDGGVTWSPIWGQYGNQQETGWHEVTIQLIAATNKLRLFAKTDSWPQSSNFAFDALTILNVDSGDDFYIEGNYIINDDYHACNNIVIKPEGKLTIGPNCTLFMPINKKIVVERSGELEINGGKITADGNGYWSGIELWGWNGQPQHPLYQGMVKINSEGTIENAVCGIQTYKPDGGPAYSGGIVWANNANFVNNVTSANFYPYSVHSASYFNNCNFLLNDELPPGFTISNFISLKGMDGVDFKNISINDIRSTVPIYQKATGIYSVDSRFYVMADCINGDPCIAWDNSTFMNLKYGIYALSSVSNIPFFVERTDFINNLKGIYISGTDLVSITLSSFNTYNFSGISIDNYGLYLDNCNGFIVEENYFYNDAASKQGIGLIVNQSGERNNMIYNNTFENLTIAALAQNENRSKDGLTGLQFKCNQFELNANDLAVTTNLPVITKKVGIAASQGANLNLPDAPAGNRFSHTGPLGTPSDINNQSQYFTYYYHVANVNYHLKPEYYTTSTITATPNTNPNAYWDTDESCPSHLGGGGGTGNGNGNKDEMVRSEQTADSILNIITALEDGGNTIELAQEVNWSISPESMDVYNELISKSPYLTDTVIGAAIDKENVLVNAMIRDVMVANPQSAKDDELLEKLNERSNPMPDFMLGQILQGRNLVSVYEDLQSKLTYYSQQRAYAYHSLVNEYLTDTLNHQASMDSLAELWTSEHSILAKYSLAFLRMFQGYFSAGLSIINDVPSQFDLTEVQQFEHQILVEYFILLSDINGNLPDSTAIQQLFEIEAQETGIASVYARNLLISLDEMSYEEPIILPDMLKSSKEIRYEQLMLTAQELKYLEIFPNPSKDHIIISWKLDNAPNNAKISITDNTGKCISEWAIEEFENQQVFDTRNFKPGVYIVTLYGNNKYMESTKFTIVK